MAPVRYEHELGESTVARGARHIAAQTQLLMAADAPFAVTATPPDHHRNALAEPKLPHIATDGLNDTRDLMPESDRLANKVRELTIDDVEI